MPVPSPRNSIRIARGNYADLNANVTAFGEGEFIYAIDQDRFYTAASGVLVAVGAGVVAAEVGATIQAYDADNVVSDVAPTFTSTVQTTERTITAGAFDLATGNHWTWGLSPSPLLRMQSLEPLA